MIKTFNELCIGDKVYGVINKLFIVYEVKNIQRYSNTWIEFEYYCILGSSYDESYNRLCVYPKEINESILYYYCNDVAIPFLFTDEEEAVKYLKSVIDEKEV